MAPAGCWARPSPAALPLQKPLPPAAKIQIGIGPPLTGYGSARGEMGDRLCLSEEIKLGPACLLSPF